MKRMQTQQFKILRIKKGTLKEHESLVENGIVTKRVGTGFQGGKGKEW